MMNRVAAGTQRLWEASRPLTAAGLGLLILFGVTMAPLAVDPRVITGRPGLVEAGQVRDLHRRLRPDARLGHDVSPGLAATDASGGVEHRRGAGD